MKTASIKEIKTALEQLDEKELLQACLRLAKFKKENKELLSYLLYDSSDESGYVQTVQQALSELFEEVNRTNLYFAKKTLRKIVRTANRYIRYSVIETTEPEILIFVASEMQALGLNLKKSTALENIYLSLLKKIKKSVGSLHEDLQYDFQKQIKLLEEAR
jgi:hypothetical protein